MRIVFCTPFKPLDHPRLSGDVTLAQDFHAFFKAQGHDIALAPGFETTWIYRRPRRWAPLLGKLRETRSLLKTFRPHAWVTYSSYYKAPDLLGQLAPSARVPYYILSGAYAQKRRKPWNTKLGYHLNKRALKSADHHFLIKKPDVETIQRIVAKDKTTYIKPGIHTGNFPFDPSAREQLRQKWAVGDTPLIATAAVFRPGVKVQGIEWVIQSIGRLRKHGLDCRLLVCGDGPARGELEALAQSHAPGRVLFAGLVPRWELYQYFSAADLFAFPGVNEGLGMLYLEAQCCGLPAVAFDHAGAPEVVQHEKTGLITPSFNESAFDDAIRSLCKDAALRKSMSAAAMEFVRKEHDLTTNYRRIETQILKTNAMLKGSAHD